MCILPKIQTVGAARTIVGDAPQYHLQCTGAAVSEAAPGDIIAKQPGASAQPRVLGWIRKPPSCMPPKLPLSKQPPRGLPSRLHVAVPSAGRTPPLPAHLLVAPGLLRDPFHNLARVLPLLRRPRRPPAPKRGARAAHVDGHNRIPRCQEPRPRVLDER